jgi:hypothetical protein
VTLVLVAVVAVGAVGCGPDSGEGEFWRGNVTLVNSFWKDVLRGQDELRTGQTLYLQTVNPALVTPDARYAMKVENLRSHQVVLESETLSDRAGRFEMAALLHDLGQEDGIAEGDELRITLGDGRASYDVNLRVATRGGDSEFRAMAAEPLVFASDSQGNPVNAFVFGDHYPSEVAGPVYVTATGLPMSATEVDIYVVRDDDRWAGKPIPTHANEGLMAGPIRGKVSGGKLAPTSTGFWPTEKLLGIYDILIDVDRNGVFDYEYTHKDGADGEAKIGFTVQYSAKWIEGLKDRHVLVNLAYDSFKSSSGTFRNVYQRGDKVFVYVNPPVNHDHHGKVTKWIVAHRDFTTFWDKPEADGAVPFSYLSVQQTQTVPQRGCTNSPPIYIMSADTATDPETGQQIDRFDIVLDYNGDGRYQAGVDILDVAGVDEKAAVIPLATIRALPPKMLGGFRVQ